MAYNMRIYGGRRQIFFLYEGASHKAEIVDEFHKDGETDLQLMIRELDGVPMMMPAVLHAPPVPGVYEGLEILQVANLN